MSDCMVLLYIIPHTGRIRKHTDSELLFIDYIWRNRQFL